MKKYNTILTIIAVILISTVLFTALSYLTTKSEKLIGVNIKKDDVPYEAQGDLPENTTLLLCFEDGYGIAMHLDFSNRFIDAVILEDPSVENAEKFGYFVDETVICDYSFILEFIDILDGITLNIFGEELRYTGVQVCNIIAVNKDSIETKRKIISAVFDKIYKIGFSSEALSCIINNTETSLNVPDCFGWTDHIGNMCGCYNIVNEG